MFGNFDGVAGFLSPLLAVTLAALGSFEIGDYTKRAAVAMFLLFAFFVIVLMLNLLIAIMGDAYSQVNERELVEGLHERAKMIVEQERRRELPLVTDLRPLPARRGGGGGRRGAGGVERPRRAAQGAAPGGGGRAGQGGGQRARRRWRQNWRRRWAKSRQRWMRCRQIWRLGRRSWWPAWRK